MTEDHTHHGENHTKHLLLLGAAGLAGALIFAPYVLPLLGKGSSDSAHMMMSFIGGEAAPGFYGSGIAGTLQEGIANLPWVGSALTSTAPVTIPGIGLTLASGALTTILASAFIGIGGMMLANWIQKREKTDDKIHWSKIIRTVSLATSILISLPSILTGISIGITFLADLINSQWGNQTAYAMSSDYGLGAISMAAGSSFGMGALSGLSSVLPHLITCGAAILPVGLATFLGGTRNPQHVNDSHAITSTPFELVSATPITKDQPCSMAFRLRDPVNGSVLTPESIRTTHTEKLHLMLVDKTLGEYHHIHPTYDASSGLFTCDFTPRTQQPFTVWCDFTPSSQQVPVQARASIPATRSISLPPRITTAGDVAAGGISAHIRTDGPLTAGRDAMLRVELRDSAGQPISALGPIMGAYGHLAGFSADTQHFIHAHPLTELGEPIQNGTLEFHISPKHAGLSKFFLQLNYQGREVVIPFGQVIAPSLRHADKITTPAQGSYQHAMA